MVKTIQRVIMLALFCCMGQISYAATKTVTIGNFKYKLDLTTYEASLTGLGDNVTSVENVIIPDQVVYDGNDFIVTAISANAFSSKGSKISGELRLPNNLVKIGESAFLDCKNLIGELIFPNSLTTIGSSAFKNCSGFTGTLSFPPLVTNLQLYSFSGCSGFTGLNLTDNIKKVNQQVFRGCSGMTGELVIPGSVQTWYCRNFYQCGFTRVKVLEGVTQIADRVFEECPNLEYVELPSTITTIEEQVFSKCPNLKEVVCKAVEVPSYGRSFYYDGANNIHYYNLCIFSTSDSRYPPSSNKFPYNSVVVKVPIESISKYQKAFEWKAFQNIKAIEHAPEQIVLDKEQAAIEVGETLFLVANILPEDATDKSVTWKSSDEAIATVDANGKVTAVAVGKVTITATATSGIIAECAITVVETPASEIIIDKDALGITGDNLEMRVGDVKSINVTVIPETTTDKSVTYGSSNSAIASVDENGNVTALNLGTTTLSIIAKSGVSASINVTVVATLAGSITLNKTEAILKANETVDLVATILPETTTDKSVKWKSADETIATVDANGKVTAVAVGKTSITATAASGITAECVVTVIETPAGGITIDKETLEISGDNLEMCVGDVKSIKVIVTPDTTTDKSVTYESSNPKVASVDENGIVTALSLGSTTITITAKSNPDVKAILNITVLAPLALSIELEPTSIEAIVGNEIQLRAKILPELASEQTLEWKSSNSEVASVSSSGLVKILKEGTAVIEVRTTDGSEITATCNVSGMSSMDSILGDVDSCNTDIYTLQGICIKHNASLSDIKALSPGFYIIAGKKVLIK